MGFLPVETWRDIVKLHLHSDEWRALSTTSSFFRQIAQEALYESVTLLRRLYGDADCVENFQLAQFVRSLAERPELASLVRSLTIWNDSIEDEEPRMLDRPRNHPVLRNLAAFSLLRQLTLGDFFIDEEFCSALHSHPRLTKVTFMSCSTRNASPETNLMQPHPESSIPTMNITQPYGAADAHAWAAVVPIGLKSLELFIPDNPTFFDALLSFLAVQRGPTALTSLSIQSTRTPPPSILTILISSPQLRSFSIYGRPPNAPDRHPLHSLPMDAIPLLEEFTAPVYLCATFIRDRPVHSVKLIFGIKTPVDALTSLKLSTVSVTSIEFSGFFMDKPYLMFAPVSTVYFGWSTSIRSTAASMVLPSGALSRLKNLRLIRGNVLWTVGVTARENRLERAEFVETYSETCPSIQEFDFGQERWLIQVTGWERFSSI